MGAAVHVVAQKHDDGPARLSGQSGVGHDVGDQTAQQIQPSVDVADRVDQAPLSPQVGRLLGLRFLEQT